MIDRSPSQHMDTHSHNRSRNWQNHTSSWHINTSIDWVEYARTYTNPLLTNKDKWSHFKYILNRKLVLRSFCPSENGSERCRCCGRARETHSHLLRCHKLWEVWKVFRRFSNSIWKHNDISNELIFLGVTKSGNLLPQGLMVLHKIMWKMVIIALTKIEFEGGILQPKNRNTHGVSYSAGSTRECGRFTTGTAWRDTKP